MNILRLKQDFNSSKTHYLLFIFLIFIQYLLFKSAFERELFYNYLVGYDQGQYLSDSYRIHFNTLRFGFLESLKISLKNFFPVQGILLQIESSIIYFFLGVGRFSALTLNFIYFIFFQSIIFWGMQKISKGFFLSWVALAFVLSIHSVYWIIGGIFDFRIDFSAFCFFGSFLVLIYLSRAFLLSKYTSIIVFFSVYLCFLRSLFFVYLSGIYFLFSIVLFVIFKKRHKKINFIRLKNFGIVFALTEIIFLPYVFINWKRYYNYYVIGHVIGEEKKIRALEVGIFNTYDHLTFYFKQIYVQMGAPLFYLIITSLFFIFLSFCLSKKRSLNKELQFRFNSFNLVYIFIFLSFLVPFIVLTLNVSKSNVVASIFIPSILLFFLLILDLFKNFLKTQIKFLFLISFLFLGASQVWSGYCSKINYSTDYRQIRLMHEDIARYFIERNITKIVVSSNYLSEYVYYRNILCVAYEKFNYFLEVEGTPLGEGIFQISKEKSLSVLERSDLFLYYEKNYPCFEPPFPFYDSMEKTSSDLESYAYSNFSLIREYDLMESGNKIKLFVRPSIRILGLTTDFWVTELGIDLIVPVGIHNFAIAFEPLSENIFKNLKISSEVLEPKNSKDSINLVVKKQKGKVILHCVLSSSTDPFQNRKIRLKFYPFEIPKNLGIGDDTRKLTLRNPQIIEINKDIL